MTPSELIATLREFHHERLALRHRHVAVARHVSDYNFNNTYQNIIGREDVHLAWVEAALRDLGETPANVDEPRIDAPGRKAGFLPLVREDAEAAEAFVTRWRPRVAAITNARHRKMAEVVLGETLEHKRFFDQMVTGNEDLLGRRSNGPGKDGTGDGVLPVRWIE